MALVGVIVLDSNGSAVAVNVSSLRATSKVSVMSGSASCLISLIRPACSSVVRATKPGLLVVAMSRLMCSML
ncbi:hypothetical protein D3C86_2031960 [compost metagenome]